MTAVTTPRGFKLGKLEATRPAGLGDLKTYLTATLTPPEQAHYGHNVQQAGQPWGMLANGPDPTVTIAPPSFEGCGDCVVACSGHYDLMSNYDEGGVTAATLDGNLAVEDYCKLVGCTPAQLFSDPDQYDTGLNISNVLATWQQSGCFGTQIAAYAPVDVSNLNDVKEALYLGGGLIIGVQLPESAEQEFPSEWEYVPGSPILGGHCVLLSGYEPASLFGVSWGQLIQISWAFFQEYCDEAWCVVSQQAAQHGFGASHLDLVALEADLPKLN